MTQYTITQGDLKDNRKETSSFNSDTIKIKCISSYDDFIALKPIWNNLLERTSSDCLFLGFEWIKCWLSAFGANKQLFILLASKKDEVVGIAPLIIVRGTFRGFPVREVKFIENEESSRGDFIILPGIEKDVLAAFIKFLKDKHRRWDVIYLKNIPLNSTTNKALQTAIAGLSRYFGIKDGYCTPFITNNSSWDDYWNERKSSFRRKLKERINKLNKFGTWSVRLYENVNENAVMNEILDIFHNSWKVKTRTSFEHSIERKNFFRELTKDMSNRKSLFIWILTMNEKPVAYRYTIKHNNKLYGLICAFDKKFHIFAPGNILMMNAIKFVFENNLSEYDMCGGSELYKLSWTNYLRTHKDIFIFKKNIYGHLLYLLEFRLIRALKQIIFAKKIITNINSDRKIDS